MDSAPLFELLDQIRRQIIRAGDLQRNVTSGSPLNRIN